MRVGRQYQGPEPRPNAQLCGIVERGHIPMAEGTA